MNILYLGPYRDDTAYGELSRQYIKTLKLHNNHLHLKPYFLENLPYALEDHLQELEHNTQNIQYDYCIQHLPLDRLAYSGYYRNVAIPIFGGYSNITDINIVETMNGFDKIIVNTDQEIGLLLKSDIKPPILKADIDLSEAIENIGDKKFNFGAHNYSHKFYGFFHYKREHDLIKKLLMAFYIAFRCREGQSIILSIAGDQEDQKDLSQFIQQTKNELNIKTSNKSLIELFLFSHMGLPEQIALHKTCETLLCFSHGTTILHKTIAKAVNNHIIDEDSAVAVDVPCYSNQNRRYLPDDNHVSVLTNSLINNMREFVYKQPTQSTMSKDLTLISKLL
jgi:hypothetical protein